MNAPRILIVDDEVNIRLMLRTLLEADGYRVSEATNGREALDQLERDDFDLMILDLNMPILDGIGVLEQLQAAHIDAKPRVIVLTAYGSIATAVKATRLGALDFLEKPATPDEIRQTVTAVLKEPQPARPETSATEVPGGYAGVLSRVRRALRVADFETAETLLMRAADLAHQDAPYFNLLGIIYEARQQTRLARKFYGKAIKVNRNYEPAQQNMRRLYELNTFGRTKIDAALGDEFDDAWLSQASRSGK
jgi:DNA-binding response OmpR family regulator